MNTLATTPDASAIECANDERDCSQARTSHELLGLVRPSFRLVGRPSSVGVTSSRCSACCDLPELQLGPFDHRAFERSLRDGLVPLGCLACLGGHAYVYYSQSVLAFFLGMMIQGRAAELQRLVSALRWMRVFVPSAGALHEFSARRIVGFSASQRFLVGNSLDLARPYALRHGLELDLSGKAANAWYAR